MEKGELESLQNLTSICSQTCKSATAKPTIGGLGARVWSVGHAGSVPVGPCDLCYFSYSWIFEVWRCELFL